MGAGFWGCSNCEGAPSELKKVEVSAQVSTRVSAQDSLGRTVTLPVYASRIASLSPGFTEIFFAVGCGDKVILRDKWSDYPPEASDLPFVSGLQPAVDKIAGFKPDLTVLYFKDARHAKAFDKIGLPVFILDPKSFDEVADSVETLGKLCGQAQRARILAANMRKTRDDVVAKTKKLNDRPLTYVEIDGSDTVRPWTVGPGSFIHELLIAAGGRNAAGKIETPYAQVTAESIVRSRPEAVLLLHVGSQGRDKILADFRARPGWQGLQSMSDKMIITSIDKDTLTRPGPRLAGGLEQLFKKLHGLSAEAR